MAGGPSTPELVAAAAAAGSFGYLPAGYRTASQFAADLAAVRRATPDFGVNLFVPDPSPVNRRAVMAYREAIRPEAEQLGVELGEPRWTDEDDWGAKIDLLLDDPVPSISFTFGLPASGIVRRLRKAGSQLLITVTDADEARAAAELEPDGLVVQSVDAGGHRGTLDQHRAGSTEPLDALVRAVLAATGLPVIAAGGLATAAEVARVLRAGARAAQVGTALLLADEAGTRPVHRRALTDPASRTGCMRAFTGRTARGIRNTFSDTYDRLAPVGYPAIHHITGPLRRWAASHQDRNRLHLWAGAGHRAARSGPVAELVTRLSP
jgi:NAD(P)H-dependent flavin oxidoreductase YrpB (nitropropane dioxygenase family)